MGGPKIGIRLSGARRASTPGPGNYNIHSSYKSLVRAAPGFSMSRRLPSIGSKKNKSLPGPGAYNLHSSSRSNNMNNSSSFTMRPRTQSKLRGGARDTPGAKYDIPSTIGRPEEDDFRA